ncbi:site-specific integrase [Muriicola sp. Z0-33]|uniref:site-specific integrase n=1 Tax=Muriicola sp. Z0-33 TaxID=2816957 RepID=UPI0022384763|nr:site-specific integrase [Muriicola sp. Z0-33]MCW5514728.1 site-specific integrase [Muriicola sp. Z0-33]
MSVIERTKGTIRFAFKESLKSLSKTPNQSSLIYLHFSYGKKRFKYSTGYSCSFNDWDLQKQRVRNKAHILNRGEINDYLNRLESELKKELTRLDSLGIPITIEGLKSKLDQITSKSESKEDDGTVAFYQYYDVFLKRNENRLKPITLRSYRQTRRLLKEFNTKLNFDDFDYDFYDDFVQFLQEDGKKANTVGKHIKNLKAVLRSATNDGHNQNLIFTSRHFKVISELTTAIYLNEDELEKIRTLDLSGFPNWDRARDIFIIGCYTGQRVSDYNGLTDNNFHESEGIRFFRIHQQKTGKEVFCPITKEIDYIINKTVNNGLPPKKMNEQDINEFIKEVGRKASIDEIITTKFTKGGKLVSKNLPKYQLIATHTARRSFCTNMYKKGMSTYEIMHFSGHSTEKEFYKYIRIEKEQRAVNIAKSGYFNL